MKSIKIFSEIFEIPESGNFLDCCCCCCCFLNIRLLEADFRTAPGAIVGVVAVFIAVDVVGVFLAGVVVVVVDSNFLDGVVDVAVGNFLVVADFSFPLSLLTASSSLDKTGSEKLARLKWSNSGGKRFVPLKKNRILF